MKIIKPNRVARTYTQRLVAPPTAVFPLLCPVRKAGFVEMLKITPGLTDSPCA